MQRNWLYWIIYLLLVTGQVALSQSSVRIRGTVVDGTTGTPVADAIVRLRGTAFHAQSDESGRFYLENVPPGEYQLVVERLGFQKKTVSGIVVRPDVATRITIRLQPAVLSLQEILVEASPQAENGTTPATVVIPASRIQQLKGGGIPAILHQIAGVQVESTDGSGEHLRIRIHGSKANQVLVLLDGQRLNNPQTGEVDLSVIPLESIERIEVIPHGFSARYGGNAYAGVVAFYTRRSGGQSGVGLTARGGSFRTASGSVNAYLDRNPFQLVANYRQSYSLQNFPYGYQNNVFIRTNAWSRYRQAFVKGGYRSPKQQMTASAQFREGGRGLPSPYFNNYRDFGAFSTEQWFLGQIFHQYILGAQVLWQTRLSFNQLSQTFNNEADPSPFTRFHTRNQNRTLEANSQMEFTLTSRWHSSVGVHYLQEILQQDNVLYPRYSIGQKQRIARAAFITTRKGWDTLPYLQLLQVQAALRIENYFNLPAKGFPFVALSLVPSALPSLSVSVSWQRAVRYPDFNSLFWKGDARARGNPDLRPEEKQGSMWTLVWQPGKASLSMRYFRENLTDLIYWHRGVNGVWQPRNLRSAFKEGVDVSLEIPFWQNHGTLQLAYNWIRAINTTPEPNTYRKQIVFIPPHTVNATLQFQGGSFWGALFFRYVAERQTVPANSPGTQLLPYRIWDVQLNYKKAVGPVVLQLGVQVQNIFNQDYQLIFGYPMPRRAGYVTCQIQWTHK